jgi:hypothetical protein
VSRLSLPSSRQFAGPGDVGGVPIAALIDFHVSQDFGGRADAMIRFLTSDLLIARFGDALTGWWGSLERVG